MDKTEFEVDDQAWIINGMRNRAFKVIVVEVTDILILVRSDDARLSEPGKILEFKKETGEAYDPRGGGWKTDPPILVPDGTPRVLEIEHRRKHREFRQRINDAANDYNENPTQANYSTLIAVAEEWNKNSTGFNFNTETIETAIRKTERQSPAK